MINDILKLKNKKANISNKNNYTTFSILIPIIIESDILKILFEIRSESLRNQPNEICLPGGKIEKDEDELTAAIREASEELRLDPHHINVIGPSDTLITPFNYIIYTHVGVLNNYKYTFNGEVNEVFTVPLSYFISQKPKCYYINVDLEPDTNFPYHLIQNGKSYKWGKGKYPVYFYKYKDKIIWGITARIIYDFITRLKENDSM